MSISPQTLLLWVDTFGWALLHFLWQGALVGIGYAAIRPLCRNVGARYWAGMACLAAMLVCPAATLAYLWPTHAAHAASAALALPDLRIAAAGGGGSGGGFETWLPWLVGLWFFGASTIALRAFLHWRRLNWLVRHASVALPDCARVLERLCRRFGIVRPVRLLGSMRVATPMLIGWLRPVILLPLGMLSGFTPQQIELIIAHELGHVRRWDYLANVLQVVIETVLFYHPVVHWISRDVRDARESCCDDLVLALADGSPVVYASTLADLEQLRHDGLAAAPALAASGGVLLERIRRIVGVQGALYDPLPRSGGWPVVLLVALGMLAALRLHAPSADIAATLQHAPAEAVAAISGNPRLLAPITVVPAAAPASAPALPATAPAVSSTVPNAAAAPARPVAPAARAPDPEPIRQVARPHIVIVASTAPARAVVDIRARLAQLPALAVPAASASAAVQAPLVLRRVQPDYPLHEKLRGIGGDVQLEFAVGADGSPGDIRVVRSVPARVFDRVAIAALEQWRFAASGQAGVRYTQNFAFAIGTPAQTADSCREVIGSHICRHMAAADEQDP